MSAVVNSSSTVNMPQSEYTQGNVFITCAKHFSPDLDQFISGRRDVVWNHIKKTLPTFVDVLKYVTGDLMIENDEYIKAFLQCLQKPEVEAYLKSITTKHRKLRKQIMEIIEGEAVVCDYSNCMRFFSDLLGCNITVIVHDTTKSCIDGKYAKNLHLFVGDEGDFDYAFKSTSQTEKKYGEYLSAKLAEDMTIADLRELYMKIHKVCARKLTKKQILEKIS